MADNKQKEIDEQSDMNTPEDGTTGVKIIATKEDCSLHKTLDCPFGISGKKGGECTGAHRKICQKFFQWGGIHSSGCSDKACEKLHPLVCPNGRYRRCYNPQCKYKLHVKSCRRGFIEAQRRAQRKMKKQRNQSKSLQKDLPVAIQEDSPAHEYLDSAFLSSDSPANCVTIQATDARSHNVDYQDEDDNVNAKEPPQPDMQGLLEP